MTVKIVTDSPSDITGDLAQESGLSVVPVYVRFFDILKYMAGTE